MQHTHVARLSILVLGLLACSDSAPSGVLDVQPQFAKCATPPCGGPNAASAALEFGGSQGTETPDRDALDLTSTFTIEGWIKPTQTSGLGFQDIVSKWGLSVSASYSVAFQNDGRLGLTTHTPGATPDNTKLFTTQPLPSGTWTHFAMVLENGQAQLYLNGQLDNQRGDMNTPQVTPSLVTLGRQKSPEGFIGDEYVGVMDEIRIWSVARSAKEIARDMDKRPSGKADGLVAYWRMNEGSGQTAADETANGHDLQLGNTSGADAADPMWVSPGR